MAYHERSPVVCCFDMEFTIKDMIQAIINDGLEKEGEELREYEIRYAEEDSDDDRNNDDHGCEARGLLLGRPIDVGELGTSVLDVFREFHSVFVLSIKKPRRGITCEQYNIPF